MTAKKKERFQCWVDDPPQQMCSLERFHRASSGRSRLLCIKACNCPRINGSQVILSKTIVQECLTRDFVKDKIFKPSSVAVLGLKFISFTVLSLLPVAIRSPLDHRLSVHQIIIDYQVTPESYIIRSPLHQSIINCPVPSFTFL